jgi:hypothetical protein
MIGSNIIILFLENGTNKCGVIAKDYYTNPTKNHNGWKVINCI